MSKTAKTALFVVAAIGLIGSGCSNEQDQQREDAAATLTSAEGLVQNASLVVRQKGDQQTIDAAIDAAQSAIQSAVNPEARTEATRRLESLQAFSQLQDGARSDLKKAISDLDALAGGQNGEDGQRAAAALLSSSAHQLLAELQLSEAEPLHAANATDLNNARKLIELAARAKSYASAVQQLPDGAALSDLSDELAGDRSDTVKKQQDAAETVQTLESQAVGLESDNDAHQDNWNSYNSQAEAAETSYRELGPDDGYTHFQDAVQSRIAADAEEFGIEENNIRLEQIRGSGEIVGELPISQVKHEGLTNRLQLIGALEQELKSFQGDLQNLTAKLNRDASTLEAEAVSLLENVDDRSRDDLAPLYESASASLKKSIASASKAKAGLKAQSRSLIDVQKAQAHSTQGRMACLIAETEASKLAALLEMAGLNLPADAEQQLLAFDGSIAAFISGDAQQAATSAGAHEMITALPSGYDTIYGQWRSDVGSQLLTALDAALQNAGVSRDASTAVRAYLTEDGASIDSLGQLVDAARTYVPTDMREAFDLEARSAINEDLIAQYRSALVLPRRISIAKALASGSVPGVTECNTAIAAATQQASEALTNAAQALSSAGSDPNISTSLSLLQSRISALSGQNVDWDAAAASAATAATAARSAAPTTTTSGAGSAMVGGGYPSAEALVAAINDGSFDMKSWHSVSPGFMRMMNLMTGVQDAMMRAAAAIEDRWPGAGGMGGMGQMGGMPGMPDAGFTIANQTDSRAELQAAGSGDTFMGAAVNVNGRWFFSMDEEGAQSVPLTPEDRQNMAMMESRMESMIPALEAAIADVERKIRNGEFASADEAGAALMAAMFGGMGMGDFNFEDLGDLFGEMGQ